MLMGDFDFLTYMRAPGDVCHRMTLPKVVVGVVAAVAAHGYELVLLLLIASNRRDKRERERGREREERGEMQGLHQEARRGEERS